MKKFPRYFIVDFETYVKVDELGDIVTGINQLGNPYSPTKVLVEGEEITEKKFNEAVNIAKKKKFTT